MTSSSELGPAFRHVRLLLARETGHPAGDREEGYDLLIPLGVDAKLDPAEWKKHQDHCRVRRFEAGSEDRIGRLRPPSAAWQNSGDDGRRGD